jgi:hypothetical protein
MSPKRLAISTSYKTRVALENPCKKRQGIVIGQLKDSGRISAGSACSAVLEARNSAIVTAVKGIGQLVTY